MRNYGEEIVYWYFRLNGFFPLANFVRHRTGGILSSDCDLIAVRFPYAWEEIGLQPHDLDDALFSRLGQTKDGVLAVLVQVKTGAFRVPDISHYFTKHLDYLVRRVGVIRPDDVAPFVEAFDKAPSLQFPTRDGVFSKMAVVRAGNTNLAGEAWLPWDFDHTIDFIRTRFRRYSEKHRDRMFFPDSLIQFLADQAHNVRQPQLFPNE